jgi:hypothetical protein
VPEGRVAVPASDTPAPDPSISTSQKAAAEPDSGANVPANAIEAVPAVPVPTIQAGRQGSRVDQSTGVIAPSSPLQVVTNVEGIRAKDDAGRSLSASELSGTDAPAQDGDSGTQVAAAPTAGDGNAPLSSSPLAFAARLNALPSDSQQSPPLQQPTAEPQATRSQASQASVQSSPALESNAIQPPAVSQAVQTAPEQTGERAEKFDGQALSATSAAVEQAAAPKTDATHALDRPADVRSADVDQAPPASTNLTAVRDVRLQVSGSDNQRVDVRVMDRGGELRVSVRADDPSLVRSLQDNVGDLSTRLDQARFQSEVWTPRMEAASQTDSANTNGNGRAFSNGGETFGRDGQGQQNGRQQQQPFWVDDFEENPAGSNPGGTKQWQP